MKKKLGTLIGLVVFLVALLGVYVVLNGKNNAGEGEDSGDNGEEVVYILDWSEEKTHKISLLDENGEKITFFKDDDLWKIEKYEKKSLITEEIQSMIGYASAIEAERKIENVEDLSEYGLDKPLNVIERETEDGKTESFTIGMHSESTGCTYIYLNDETDVVYAVGKNMGNLYKYEMIDFIQSEAYPSFVSDNVQKVEVVKEKDSFTLTYDFSTTTCWVVEDETYGKKLADEYQGDNLASMVSVLSYSEFYEDDCQDFSVYGLDEPQMEIRVTYHETVEVESEESEEDDDSEDTVETETIEHTFVLSVGGYDDAAGYYYVRMNDSKEVHGLAATHVDKLLGETVVDYWALNMSEVSLDHLDYLEVEYAGESYVFEKVVTESSEDEDSSSITTYYLDDEEVNEDLFENFYRGAIGVECQERKIEIETEKDAELILKFHSTKGETVTVSYIPLDENFHAVINNGTDYGLVNKMKIKDLVELFLKVVE